MSTIYGSGPGPGPGNRVGVPSAQHGDLEEALVTERLTSAPATTVTPAPTPSAGLQSAASAGGAASAAGSGSFAAEPSVFSHPRFELLARLGRGGMGVVYAAYDRDKLRRVALKTLHTLEPESLLRFKNEFRALADLQHDNLVRLDELFEQSGQWFFTMELIEGASFLSFVRPAAGSVARQGQGQGLLDSASSTSQERTASATAEVTHSGPPSQAPAASIPPPQQQQLQSGFDERRLRDTIGQLTHGLCALHAADKVHCGLLQ